MTNYTNKQTNKLVFASSHQQMLSITFCKVQKEIFTVNILKIKQENFYSMERNYITLNFMSSNFFGGKKMAKVKRQKASEINIIFGISHIDSTK